MRISNFIFVTKKVTVIPDGDSIKYEAVLDTTIKSEQTNIVQGMTIEHSGSSDQKHFNCIATTAHGGEITVTNNTLSLTGSLSARYIEDEGKVNLHTITILEDVYRG